MDKNTIIGFLLIGAVVIGFSIYSKPSDEEIALHQKQQQIEDSIKLAQTTVTSEEFIDSLNKTENQTEAGSFFGQNVAETTTDSTSVSNIQNDSIKNVSKDETLNIENDLIKLGISTRGGQIVSSQLKGYKTFKGDSLYLLNNNARFSLLLTDKKGRQLDTKDAVFTANKTSDSTIVMRLSYSDTKYVDFIYSLGATEYMVNFDIRTVGMGDILDRSNLDQFQLIWEQALSQKEKYYDGEQRYSQILYKVEGSDVEKLSETSDEKQEITVPVKWVGFKDQFFATTLIADYNIEIAQLASKVYTNKESGYLKDCSAHLYIPTVTENDGSVNAGFRFFMGPLEYSRLKDFDNNITDARQKLDLDKMVPLGWSLFRWINQYFIIPLFSWLGTFNLNMGLVILILTIIVKIIISPLTYKSFLSSAKMRVLRPQIEELNAKFPKTEQMQERQQATMKLYNSAGVNPMSGCIPMLLQMPILIALFQFFPSAIELRQESFLWALDLSTYDDIISWGFHIPLIGSHLSIFCLLMTVTNIVYTKFNMDATNTGQQQIPGMKWMMYLMPVVFLFVLNNYPAGLTYYYFVSTLITIILTIAFRYLIDEEKLLKQLEENKKKPKKKSGFMARLEEAQKLQEQQARAKAKQQNKKK